ncbi:MAG: hypothetical protein GWN86_19025 [Desulfobacterales bacterium]|nr:hypothetical protein [Desulfobacterales bacterium]
MGGVEFLLDRRWFHGSYAGANYVTFAFTQIKHDRITYPVFRVRKARWLYFPVTGAAGSKAAELESTLSRRCSSADPNYVFDKI